LELVPAEKMPNDFFTIGLAEILIRGGKVEEGEKLLYNIVDYSREYLDYTLTLTTDERFGLEYATGINMQALLDIYNMSVVFKLTSLTEVMEPVINNYYSKLYSAK